MQTWKVGALARQTGLTVRTLHHYDEIGLLVPSLRTGAGHRLYTADDLGRLVQILSLRQLGLSLDDVRESLARPESTLQQVLGLHIAKLRERIDLQQRLCRRLETVAERLRAAETVSVDDFIQTLEAMTMFEKHFTPEQLQEIQARGQQVGPERIREVEAEWPRLIAQVRAEMEKGTDPASATVQDLARRWKELLHEFTGGNPGIQKGLNTMYAEEPEVRSRTGIDPALMEYIGKAFAAK
ncbi:MAG TPA: TipAS antibiotic-recognition domain-containing protein [Thermoanaerobaculia bacterium]|jgi:DNA-binding transcriptional MerR regulator|nr:TipAS antibiotic-recognition domain-containing protein [Thermoanaerobaculia bacterium]